MRAWSWTVALLLAGVARAQEAAEECDLAKLEDGLYCAKCDALLEKDGVDKDGACGVCRKKPEKVQVCVKTYFVADC